MGSWLIENVTIVTVDDRRTVIPRGNLLIDGDSIAGLWKAGGMPADVVAENTIDGEGMVAMPGLINAHTHCAMTLLRGYADDMPLQPWLEERIWPLEMKLEAEDVYWGTLLGVAEMIRSGVTCFNDMYHYFEATARAVLESGIRASVSGVLLGFLPDAERRLDEAIDFAREWGEQGDGRLVTMLGPHAPYTCPAPLLTRVVEAAREAGIGIHIHVAETQQEVRDSLREFKQTPVARLDDLGIFDAPTVLAAHCVHLTESDIETLVAKRVGISHNPGSNMKLASGTAPIPRLLEAGAIVGMGTDGPASNNNLDMMEEMRLAALLHKLHTGDPTVVTAYQALEMATIGSARALGIDDRVGRLAPGLRADVVLLDFRQAHLFPRHEVVSHLAYAARAGDVRTVFVNGRPLMLDGELQTLDEQNIFEHVSARLKRLV